MNQDPLSALRDLHLPPVTGFWPPAIGWWLVAILLCALLGYLFYLWKKRSEARRPALAALQTLEQISTSNDSEIFKLQQLSVLLRRFALNCFERSQVAGLNGDSWLVFLDDHLPGSHFCNGGGRPLATAPYQEINSEFDIDSMIDLVKQWIVHNDSSRTKQPSRIDN